METLFSVFLPLVQRKGNVTSHNWGRGIFENPPVPPIDFLWIVVEKIRFLTEL